MLISDKEILDMVDENDNVIGKVRKVDRKKKCANYRLSIIMIENGRKELLFGLRSKNKSYSGEWHIIGGHVKSGEGYQEAAKRELKEETGLELDLKPIKKSRIWQKRGCWVFSAMFFARYESGNGEELAPDKEEFDRLRFFPLEYIKSNPNRFSRPTLDILNDYLSAV